MPDRLVTKIVTSVSDAKDVKLTPINPPVVLSKGKVSLADHLDLRNLPLATTPGGTNFCMKALHPSEHTIKTARVPGGNELSVSLALDMIHVFDISNNNSRVEIVQTANPIIPCAVLIGHTAGGIYTSDSVWDYVNAAFGGSVMGNPKSAALLALSDAFATNVDKYRVVSQSVTAELIAPALADQGTTIAYQWNPKRQTVSFGDYQNADVYWAVDGWRFQNPVDDSIAAMGTKAFTGKARDGYYQPLKLTGFKWRDAADRVYYMEAANLTALLNPVTQQAANTSILYPYVVDRSSATKLADCEVLPKMCSTFHGIGVLDGLATSTSVRVRVRQVLEITARPGTTYAPLLEAALPPDPTALKMYAEISARMADAYPASYNDLGKLKDLIMGIGKKVLPYVEPTLDFLSSTIPGPVGTIAGLAKQAVPIVKGTVAVVKAAKKKKKAKPPPPTAAPGVYSNGSVRR